MRGQNSQFRLQAARPAPLPPEANMWWWHPGRPGVTTGPRWFMDKLERMDPNLSLTRNRYTNLWQVWMKKPAISNRICWGWQLLFTVSDEDLHRADGATILARLFEASAQKWGGGKEYFAAIERELERDRERYEKSSRQDAIDQSMEVFDHSRISVAMRGQSNGSKFSTYHT